MSSHQTTLIPEVFVLWHPNCRLGDPLARRILAWLRPGNGFGPEVFYRSLPAPGAPANGLPLPLPDVQGRPVPTSIEPRQRHEITNQQIVIPLIDEHMVSDPAWRHWLAQLAPAPRSADRRVMMPVALDPTAYNMPQGLRELNYLRPAGVPLPDGEDIDGKAFETAARSLQKQITEAMCRLLLPRPQVAGGAPGAAADLLPKVNVFLSHAKEDGKRPAQRLRDYIYSQTQLTAFFDENDIAFGAAFSRVIRQDLTSPETAAFIAVRSARYASRPWCRRELSLFRRPRRVPSPAGTLECWRLYPSLVVEAMEGRRQSYGIPELGNCPMIRWTDSDETLEELIVTTIIRDAMLASFHATLGASITAKPGRIVLNWLPDPTTLMHIDAVRERSECEVVYPGRDLSGLDLDVLDEFFPHVTLRSFEEVLS